MVVECGQAVVIARCLNVCGRTGVLWNGVMQVTCVRMQWSDEREIARGRFVVTNLVVYSW